MPIQIHSKIVSDAQAQSPLRLVAYPSKLYALGICLFSCAIASVVLLVAWDSHKWLSLPFIGISVLMCVVSIVGFIRGRPILTADDTGILDSRISKETIQWHDILAFRHIGRIERPAKMHIAFSPFDSWRPIHLWITPPKASLLSKLQGLSPHPAHTTFPQAHFVSIDFAGLDVQSSKLAEMIRSHAPNAKEEYSNQAMDSIPMPSEMTEASGHESSFTLIWLRFCQQAKWFSGLFFHNILSIRNGKQVRGGGAGGVIRFPAVCMLIFVGLSIVSDTTTFFEFTAALSSI